MYEKEFLTRFQKRGQKEKAYWRFMNIAVFIIFFGAYLAQDREYIYLAVLLVILLSLVGFDRSLQGSIFSPYTRFARELVYKRVIQTRDPKGPEDTEAWGKREDIYEDIKKRTNLFMRFFYFRLGIFILYSLISVLIGFWFFVIPCLLYAMSWVIDYLEKKQREKFLQYIQTTYLSKAE